MPSRTVHKPFNGVRTEVTTSVSFDEVLTRLRAHMGRTSKQEVVALAQAAISKARSIHAVEERADDVSGFILFSEVDHGGWLPKSGINRRIVRWIVGNPMIAITMIEHDVAAGLFAPVELLVTASEDKPGTTITYVRPSTLMVIEENPPLLAAARVLDKKLETLVTLATTD